MAETPEAGLPPHPIRNRPQSRVIHWLLQARVAGGVRSPHIWIISILMALFAYIYYGVLTTFHDVYVVLFFYPLMYAAIAYRLRGVLVSGLVFLVILLPYVFLFSPEPYSLARTFLFAAFAFLVSGLGATLLNYLEQQVAAYEEILSLNQELEEYIGRLRTAQRQLIQSEKMNALGQLSAAIAHEINNPLAGVLVYSQLIAKKMRAGSLETAEALADIAKIETAVSHCSRLVRGLLDFSRQTEPKLQPIDIDKVITEALSLVSHQAEMNKIEVVRETSSAPRPVMADFGQLQQVLINLVVNAIQAMPGGGRLTIRTAAGEDSWVRVSVQDTGYGIAPENMEKLFTPFFSTKGEIKGVGLGLSVSLGIVERHGGRIEVESEVGRGSTFTVVLPAHADSAPSPAT